MLSCATLKGKITSENFAFRINTNNNFRVLFFLLFSKQFLMQGFRMFFILSEGLMVFLYVICKV